MKLNVIVHEPVEGCLAVDLEQLQIGEDDRVLEIAV